MLGQMVSWDSAAASLTYPTGSLLPLNHVTSLPWGKFTMSYSSPQGGEDPYHELVNRVRVELTTNRLRVCYSAIELPIR